MGQSSVGIWVNRASAPTVLAAMADPRCHIVSLTVTEKGYCHDPATGALNLQHPDIVHDLAYTEAPRSAVGFLVRTLALRKKAGVQPFTILSCPATTYRPTAIPRADWC